MKNEKSLSLFSAETLDSIAMAEILGGDPINNCNGGYCGNCATGCGGGPTPQPNNYFICSPVPVNVTACVFVWAGCSGKYEVPSGNDTPPNTLLQENCGGSAVFYYLQ